ESYSSPFSHRPSQAIDYLKFLNGLNVERKYTLLKSIGNFFIRFAHASKYNIFGPKAQFDSTSHLISSHTIGANSSVLYNFQDTLVEISFQRIMQMEPVFLRSICRSTNCFLQQGQIVKVKRSLQGRKNLLQTGPKCIRLDLFSIFHEYMLEKW